MKKETIDSGADAPEVKTNGGKYVFIPILKGDRDFVNATKGKKNRPDRMHDIIACYRQAMSFEEGLNDIFQNAIDARNDTLWHSETETLHDAILRIWRDRQETGL